MKRLLLLGGGHAHLFVLESFIKSPLPEVNVTLVTPTRLAPYSGMMPGVIAGHYRYEDGCVDLKPLCDACGCALHLTLAESLDTATRRIVCADGSTFDYDILSIDSGSTPGTGGVRGGAQHAHPVKPIDRFVADLNLCCARLAPDRPVHIAVVGAGAAGCEVLLALHYRLEQLSTTQRAGPAEFTLIGEGPAPLPGLPAGARRRMARLLHRCGVRLFVDNGATSIEPGLLRLADGTEVAADFIVWVTGSSAPAWPQAAGLACDDRGFILVDRHLRSTSHPHVFAAGDVATMVDQPRPRSGVYAVRAGPPLARNLRSALSGKALRAYRPQRRALALLSCGDRYAIGLWGPLSWEGAWVWSWKDHIDRNFVRRFSAVGAQPVPSAA
jgi:selenide,water dikinase